MSTDRSAASKFINYTREAFLLPAHLAGLTLLSLATAAVMVAMPLLFQLDGWFSMFFLAGAEFLYLGTMTRSSRFRRMVNAKYAKELLAYERMRDLTEAYNALSIEGQRRFEQFREDVKRSQMRFELANKGFPEMVEDFTTRMDDMQISFTRLLGDIEQATRLLGGVSPEQVQSQMEDLRQQMENDRGPIREMKEKRLGVLAGRLQALERSGDKLRMMEDKLDTMEDMVKLMNEQPASLSAVSHDLESIDTLLHEVKDLHGNLTDVEAIMQEYALRDREGEGEWNKSSDSSSILLH